MPPRSDQEITVVPLHAEQAEVRRETHVTGKVRVSTATRTREELIDEMLASERVEIERIPVRQLVESAPGVREEGDVIIIPVLEEVVVVERRLFLKEEVRVRRVRTNERHQEKVTLREQEVVITRNGEALPGSRGDGTEMDKQKGEA